VAAGDTNYSGPFFFGITPTNFSLVTWPVGGKLRNLRVRTSTAQPGTGSLVITVQVNLSDRALVVTIPAGSAAGVYTDLVNSADLSAGNSIRWKIVNNAATNSAVIWGIDMELDNF